MLCFQPQVVYPSIGGYIHPHMWIYPHRMWIYPLTSLYVKWIYPYMVDISICQGSEWIYPHAVWIYPSVYFIYTWIYPLSSPYLEWMYPSMVDISTCLFYTCMDISIP